MPYRKFRVYYFKDILYHTYLQLFYRKSLQKSRQKKIEIGWRQEIKDVATHLLIYSK